MMRIKRIFIGIVILLICLCPYILCGCEDSDPEREEETMVQPDVPEVPEILPEEYTVTFIFLNGESTQTVYEEGAALEYPEPEEYAGYVFREWEVRDAAGEITEGVDVVVGDMECTAKYARLCEIVVKIDLEEGAEIERRYECAEGGLLSSAVDMEKVEELLPEGYEIKGEYAADSDYDIIVNADTELRLEAYKRRYTIALHVDGTPTEYINEVKHGDIPELPQCYAKGLLFTGWYTDKERTHKYERQGVCGNTHIYAGWEEIGEDTIIEINSEEDIEILRCNPDAKYIVNNAQALALLAGSDIVFTGELDGKGGAVRLQNQALFKENRGIVSNLHIEAEADNAQAVTDTSQEEKNGGTAFGAICGVNFGTLENISISGNIHAAEINYFGGICGVNKGKITGITLDLNMTAEGVSEGTGGIAGMESGGEISGVTGSVEITSSGEKSVAGGLIGTITGGKNKISDVNLTVKITSSGVACGMIGAVNIQGTTLSGQIELTLSLEASKTSDISHGATVDDGSAQIKIEYL